MKYPYAKKSTTDATIGHRNSLKYLILGEQIWLRMKTFQLVEGFNEKESNQVPVGVGSGSLSEQV